jgi:hypothetical protein
MAADEARAVLRDVTGATSRWRTVAHEMGLNHAAVEQMALAFEHDQAEVAREIVA